MHAICLSICIYIHTGKAARESFTWPQLVYERILALRDEFAQQSAEACARAVEEYARVEKQQRRQLQLVAIGVPGLGKTTLMTAMAKLLHGQYVDQDQCGGIAKQYYAKLAQLSRRTDLPMLALGKCCHTSKIRQETIKALDVQRLVFVPFYYANGAGKDELDNKSDAVSEDAAQKDEDKKTRDGGSAAQAISREDVVDFGSPGMIQELIRLAEQRIGVRGEHHLCLHPSPKLKGILDGFAKSYEPLKTEETAMAAAVIPINAVWDKKRMLVHLMTQLQELDLLPKTVDDVHTSLAHADWDEALAFAAQQEQTCKAGPAARVCFYAFMLFVLTFSDSICLFNC